MPRTSDSFDQFIRAVHRRQVVLWIIERAGLGVALGSAAAAVLVAVSIWHGGEGAWNLAAFALAAGAGVGVIAGAVRRPSTLASASEADRQLGTSDLFSTAFALNARVDARQSDAWADTILALATERCRRHTPREVILRRLGVRAWGGILLSVAFVAVLAALSSASREAVASRTIGNDTTLDNQAASRTARQPIVDLTDVTQPPARQHRADLSPEDDRPSDAKDLTAQTVPSDTAAKPDARGSHDANIDASSPGAGGSQASSPPPRAPRAERANPSEPTAARDDATARPENGSPRAGVGRAAQDRRGTDPATGGVITHQDGAPSKPSAPWTSNTWPETVESAEQQLRAGRIPDDARDLVREYFDPAASAR